MICVICLLHTPCFSCPRARLETKQVSGHIFVGQNEVFLAFVDQKRYHAVYESSEMPLKRAAVVKWVTDLH